MASLATSGSIRNLLSLRTQIINNNSQSNQPIFVSLIRHHKAPIFTRWVFFKNSIKPSQTTTKATTTGSSFSSGLHSSQTFDLTVQNVDLVLEDVRPYLIDDGGNVDVVSVEDGVISLNLQG
ncbi:hypothetical protein GIB67_016984 [Kingdonia uniflora]|uniref:NIF system FeS cluster assembly NifU C-terminal domain-containing protein n=1 Tax=Kingdonia uniflora TaxID=39325 RepID=A0A7J7M3M3_9MAGN|nr:hypothetical protein GIB67_016984 [Kingdonia uniflora]